MTLAELFPQEDYRFRMRFERGTVGEFFRPTAQHEAVLQERKHWLEKAPHTYAALLPAGTALLDEAVELGDTERTLAPETLHVLAGETDPLRRCLVLGAAWEPDFLLLELCRGLVCLQGGCVCFPSSWSLGEKMGHPIETIHAVVPGLNAAIGPSIHAFLIRLRPGTAWLRANWGLCRSPELNQHPERALARLDPHVELNDIWLRVEQQILTALPRSHGVLFGIRIEVHSLAEISLNHSVTKGLIHALRTMPQELATYKNIATARPRILELLESTIR